MESNTSIVLQKGFGKIQKIRNDTISDLERALIKDIRNGFCPELERLLTSSSYRMFVNLPMLLRVYQSLQPTIHQCSIDSQMLLNTLDNYLSSASVHDGANLDKVSPSEWKAMQEENRKLKEELAQTKAELESARTYAEEAIEHFRNHEMPNMLEKKWASLCDEREESLMQGLKETREKTMTEMEQTAEKRYHEIIQEKLGAFVEAARQDYHAEHRELNNAFEGMNAAISTAKEHACSEASRMQREMRAYMDGCMEQFYSNMDKWRSSLFQIQLDSFAQWYANFCAYVDAFDSRLANDPDSGDAELFIRIGTGLKQRRNMLERAIRPMGLRSFFPSACDTFDPAFHVCDDEEADYGATVASCTKPGVMLVSSDEELSQVLIKAEVTIEVK